jgi:3'-phosphoadenosine 5'-phosphosulfate sulfotransferase (PAPS reductase)/FAD synthetase
MIGEMETQAIRFLDDVAADHRASGTWALLSGGDDSLATAIVTAKAATFRGCLHIDTGIGIPETQEFVRETCRSTGWPLQVYRAVDQGQDYAALVVDHGFPGPALHYKMYARLKERALRAFIRDHKIKRHDRIVLSTGIRESESQRRMGSTEQVSRYRVQVWANPIYTWSKTDCHDTIAAAGLPRNPVVELLHMSGECLCGSFAAPDELKEIALWFPAVAERIRALEARVREAGQTRACVWGQRPLTRPRGWAQRDSAGRKVGPLCQQCEFRFEGTVS